MTTPVDVLSRVVAAPSRAVTRLRRNPPPERAALVGLAGLCLVALLGSHLVSPRWFPPSLQVVPLLLGGLLLTRRSFRLLFAVAAVCVVLGFVLDDLAQAPPGAVAVVLVGALLGNEFARSRDETGLGGLRGDTLLVELRTRLEQQGRLPRLPAGWHADAVVRPAGGGPFSGDFVVSAVTDRGSLELALVDVSGKGVDAGTRSLLLSGALGGLLGTGRPREFLAAANTYVLRQDWDEGFATAAHLDVDLRTGAYTVESAGHPPVAHLDAGSGRWSLLEAEGPALGLLPGASHAACHGVLRPGDALLLYTDGLVEVSGRDLSVGIDKLLGEAERLVTQGFAGGAATLVARVAADSNDDRGLVLVWRER